MAETVSYAGTSVTLVVLPILVFESTGSAIQTSLLTAIETIPYLLFGLMAGPIADRHDRRWIMVSCNVMSGCVMASIPLAAVLGKPSLAQLYVVASASATIFVFYDAAAFGAVPALIGRERIVVAMSALTSTSALLMVLGPAVGGALAASIGSQMAIALDAASFAIAAGLLAIVPASFQAHRRNAPESGQPSEVLAGLRFIWRHPVLRPLTLIGFGSSIASGGLLGLLVVYAARQLDITPGDARIGLLFSAGGIGAVGAGLVIAPLRRRFSASYLPRLTLSAGVALLGGLAACSSFVVALPLYGLWTLDMQITVINGITYRQQVTPDHLQSRVNVVGRMIAWGGQPAGAILAGGAAEFVDVRAAVLLLVISVSISTLVAWLALPARDPEVALQHPIGKLLERSKTLISGDESAAGDQP